MKKKKNGSCRRCAFLAAAGFAGIVSWGSSLDSALGQTTFDIPSSWNPVGSGARALGMGGAFIAIADDATAASWNPGGLIQLETPEISLVGAYRSREEGNVLGTNPEASGPQSDSFTDLNYLSAAYPFALFGHGMIVALNHQNLYDFNRQWRFPFSIATGLVTIDRDIEYRSTGDLSATGLACAVRITPKLSLGATLNFWEDWLGNHGWREQTREAAVWRFPAPPPLPPPPFGPPSLPFSPPPLYTTIDQVREYSFSGMNANLGVLWRATAGLTVGAVVKTPFTAELELTETRRTTSASGGAAPVITSTPPVTSESDVEMPISYGIGLSYRFSDFFTAAMDVYRTHWDDFIERKEGKRLSPVTGLPESESHIDATTQARLGGEYLFIHPGFVIPLRAGVFYDPAPASHSPDEYYGVSIGSGCAWDRFIFDIAYQRRWGNDVNRHLVRDVAFSQDVTEHTIYSSIIIHF